MALNRKIATIDLDRETVKLEPIPTEWRQKFIGGRGLDAYLLYTNVPEGCDPLGPDNVLVISAGLLGGTPAPGANRTIVSTFSPQTLLMAYSIMGGFWAPELKLAGYDKVVIRGKSPDLVIYG